MAAEAQSLAHADFNGSSQGNVEDHSAHASGKVCKSCGQKIAAGQPARRRGESQWSHDVCPLTD